MRARWSDLRCDDFAAQAIHAVFGGPTASDRLIGTISRCAAPDLDRALCGRFAHPSMTHPAREVSGRFIPRLTHICTHQRECSHRRPTAWHSPALVFSHAPRLHLSVEQRVWVRRVVQQATGRTSDGPDLVALAAAVVVAPHGSDEERRALAALDATCKKRDLMAIVRHRITAQERLAEHLARRTRRDHPERQYARRPR